ncbi:tyrosine-type recombinase/integrase [Paenibacillus endophyticus]
MKRDCLKAFYSEYVINIPSFKQSGGYDREIIKPIPVLYAGHGKYVIDLIRRLQKQTEDLVKQYNTPISAKQEFLFTVRHWSFKNKDGKLEAAYSRKHDSIWNWTGTKVNQFFKQLALILNIREKNGELIIPTTHQFRHHAVSDRLYMVGYSIEQVRKLTGHKNETMTKQYTHQMIEKHKDILVRISGLRNSHESPYEFKGKIINLDERTVLQLSKDHRRYLTWEANGKKGVGICSDITGCNPQGTSVHFECYACNWFLPKLEYFDDYKAEYAYWQDVIDRTSLDPNRAAHTENAIRNVSYIERILEICNYGLEQYKRTQVAELTQNAEFKYQWE